MSIACGSKTKRIARRILLSVAILVLLLASYLSSYLAAVWAVSNGYGRSVGPIVSRIHPVWKPIDLYCAYDLPASRGFDRFAWWFRSGGRLTWSEASDEGDRWHDERIRWRTSRK